MTDETAFHCFGILWDKTDYTFYVDGVEDGHIDAYVSPCPQFILISGEPHGYRSEDHQPTEEAVATIGALFFLTDLPRFNTLGQAHP